MYRAEILSSISLMLILGSLQTAAATGPVCDASQLSPSEKQALIGIEKAYLAEDYKRAIALIDAVYFGSLPCAAQQHLDTLDLLASVRLEQYDRATKVLKRIEIYGIDEEQRGGMMKLKHCVQDRNCRLGNTFIREKTD